MRIGWHIFHSIREHTNKIEKKAQKKGFFKISKGKYMQSVLACQLGLSKVYPYPL